MPHGLDLFYTSLLFTVLVTGVVSSCNESSNTTHTKQVARMCSNINVTGTHVYIDADDAGSSNHSSESSCTCTVTTQVGKQMEVKLNFNGTFNQICGTTIEFTSMDHINETHSCNNATFNVTTDMNVELRKPQAPYLSTYCVSLDLQQSTPLITVMCTESKSDAQTTTAAQRTTFSPTTIATPTTTTTSQTVTTIVKTDTSVHSPDQTLLVLFAVVVFICVSALVVLCACSKKIEDNKKKRDDLKRKTDKFGSVIIRNNT
ncbi:uncharacterized protein LOC127852305 isoform X2 [Dreissena polymorpha]|uniref:uncharacterized protein LOC127852305 isoform X2 n=1 Tax=Dreissena polymorpha TaxID=45954 RepID=UPI00226477C1|nr:uncharacterized protein LOC127852305 isoform X2 [Dreissena polymorpha]